MYGILRKNPKEITNQQQQQQLQQSKRYNKNGYEK